MYGFIYELLSLCTGLTANLLQKYDEIKDQMLHIVHIVSIKILIGIQNLHTINISKLKTLAVLCLAVSKGI